MAIKTTHIDGDVSVGRNVTMGGRARIAGSMSVEHNLKVYGWLEARNIKGTNKGVFLTLQALREAYPNPQDGWFAGVGSSTPFKAYIGSGGEWVPTGGTIEVALDLSVFTEVLDQVQEDISAIKTAIADEQKERLDADLNLAERVDNIGSAIAAEEQARQAADENLLTRMAAEEQYLKKIDDELTSRIAANRIQAAVMADGIKQAKAAAERNAAAIATEVQQRKADDASILERITNEEQHRKKVDDELAAHTAALAQQVEELRRQHRADIDALAGTLDPEVIANMAEILMRLSRLEGLLTL